MHFERSLVTFFATAFAVLCSTLLSNVQPALAIVETKSLSNTYSGSFGVSKSTSLYDHQDGTKKESLDTDAKFGITFPNSHSLSMSGSYSYDQRNDEDSDFSDLNFNYSFSSMKASKYLNLNTSIFAIAPVSKQSRILQQLQTAVGGSLGFKVNPDYLISKNLSLSFGLSLVRFFHTYSTDINGSVLNQYSSRQRMSLSYSMGNFSLSGTMTHKNAFTYQDNVRESFDITEEASYAFNKKVSMSLGHSNAGSTLKPNGQDSNYEILNENSSVIYAGLTLDF